MYNTAMKLTELLVERLFRRLDLKQKSIFSYIIRFVEDITTYASECCSE